MSSKSQAKVSRPNFKIETASHSLVCGLDEVGRAPLAGPVVAACVYIPAHKREQDIWVHVNDSKKIAKGKRGKLFEKIKQHCFWSIYEASVSEVEKLNIVQASFLAMKRCFIDLNQQLETPIQAALVDGNLTPQLPCPNIQTIIKGDSKSISIAAASILAKVYRDRMMAELSKDFPYYGWERNVGYPTREHLEAIDTYGLTCHHRKTFAPVRNYVEFGRVQAQERLPL